MEIYSFKKACGKRITQYDSDFVMTRILQTTQATSVGVMYLEEGGLVGYHRATTPQLLLIISGRGYVSIDQQEYIPVEVGDAVFWPRSEWHETKTKTGMTALVIEGEEMSPFLLGKEDILARKRIKEWR